MRQRFRHVEQVNSNSEQGSPTLLVQCRGMKQLSDYSVGVLHFKGCLTAQRRMVISCRGQHQEQQHALAMMMVQMRRLRRKRQRRACER
jgi:hypothetical protein